MRGRRILVIEDDYLLAQVLIDFLEEAGAEIVGPIGWVEEALAAIDNGEINVDAAVLDVNLHGAKSYPIADALAERSVPFVFATGYGSDALDASYLDHPRCEKPFDQSMLVALLNDILSKKCTAGMRT
nr:response regulator [Bradyrhizobium sp. 21]